MSERSAAEQRVADALTALVGEHGAGPMSNAATLRSLLHDHLGAATPALRREIRLVVDAAAEGIPAALADPTLHGVRSGDSVATAQLMGLGLDESAATFAVRAWTAALGIAATGPAVIGPAGIGPAAVVSTEPAGAGPDPSSEGPASTPAVLARGGASATLVQPADNVSGPAAGSTGQSGSATQPRRRRAGLWVAASLVIVLLAGSGVVVASMSSSGDQTAVQAETAPDTAATPSTSRATPTAQPSDRAKSRETRRSDEKAAAGTDTTPRDRDPEPQIDQQLDCTSWEIEPGVIARRIPDSSGGPGLAYRFRATDSGGEQVQLFDGFIRVLQVNNLVGIYVVTTAANVDPASYVPYLRVHTTELRLRLRTLVGSTWYESESGASAITASATGLTPGRPAGTARTTRRRIGVCGDQRRRRPRTTGVCQAGRGEENLVQGRVLDLVGE